MPWFRIDDGFYDHVKVVRLQAHPRFGMALALWTLAGSWASKQMENGRVPSAIVTRLGFHLKDAEALVSVDLWHKTDDGYVFHDWARCNETREQIEERRTRTKNKVTKHRSNQLGNRLHTGDVTGPKDLDLGVGSGSSEPEPDRVVDEKRPGANTWLHVFGMAWCEKYQRITYGLPSDGKACGALDSLLERMDAGEAAAAWADRDRMIRQFLATSDPKTVESAHSFSFFVQRFVALAIGTPTAAHDRRTQPRPQTVSYKPL